MCVFFFFFFKQKTAYEMRISDWSSDVCSSDLSTVRIRGLTDILTTVNGREVVTTTGRGFDLQDVPAEALARIDAFKSQTADQIEGGVAGALDLRLNRPFDFRDPTFVLTARQNYATIRSEAHKSELQSLMSNSSDVFCLKKKTKKI